jgi:hypothetical protein
MTFKGLLKAMAERQAFVGVSLSSNERASGNLYVFGDYVTVGKVVCQISQIAAISERNPADAQRQYSVPGEDDEDLMPEELAEPMEQ